ncbi:sigma-54 dependent transcriptional regulator [Desulfuromonas carbonis]|uniref:sigma-54 dependent transcriptional regulator n=1 Tax=Desulfuromonas sp. DDH964 TaxID=1823759 RepID=UPI00078C8611|nr:sigma-54 dependent transcriptional regulator [Desulfuromonas sp. DDH964]AMV71737.1 sigma-54-dependent sensor transcriptional response regulator [Desulfuromonas sp. DDH964]
MKKAAILVVDDEESLRFTFSSFLKDAGHLVNTAESFREALAILKEHRFDLIFADILLGEKTGLDLLAELRRQGQECPVILVTGAPSLATAAEAVRLGAYDYIAKPVTRDILLRVTRMALEMQELREEKERYRINLEAIFDSVRDGLVTVDFQLKVLAANRVSQSLCCFTGLAVGASLAGLENRECHICLEVLRKCLKERRMTKRDRVTCLVSGRPVRVLSLVATPLMGPGGHFAGAVLTMCDETRLDSLEKNLGERTQLRRLTGRSPVMQKVFALVDILADVDSTVLISGESGTGKELVAEALHFCGGRRDAPLVRVNCSALTESLLESELFGHVKGAFTGAIRDKVGRFQLADGGTIFLDEIGDISPGMQVRLLRVLQEKEFERVGDARPIKVDVRIVAATNRDLAAQVRAGVFREDLYYRLKVVVVDLPPLRDRRDDLPLLVDQFLARFNRKLNRTVTGVEEEVMRLFFSYPWPGNIRELEHALEHAFILSRGAVLQRNHLPDEIRSFSRPEPDSPPSNGDAGALRDALQRAGGNKAKAARLLGISRRTLYRKLAEAELPDL